TRSSVPWRAAAGGAPPRRPWAAPADVQAIANATPMTTAFTCVPINQTSAPTILTRRTTMSRIAHHSTPSADTRARADCRRAAGEPWRGDDAARRRVPDEILRARPVDRGVVPRRARVRRGVRPGRSRTQRAADAGASV